MPLVDLIDETFLVADPAAVAAVVKDPARWRAWWPDLSLTVTRDRGVKGVQWAVAGALRGSAEVWLEPVGDGVLLHYYLRADPPEPLPVRKAARLADRERDRRARAWKRHAFALKDQLEEGRAPGTGRVKSHVEAAE